MVSDPREMRPEPSERVSLARPSRRYYENREKDMSLSWRTWLRDRYARYWYLLGVFLLDLLVAGTALEFGTGLPPATWQYVLALVLVIALAYPEYYGYRRLWPPPPPLE